MIFFWRFSRCNLASRFLEAGFGVLSMFSFVICPLYLIRAQSDDDDCDEIVNSRYWVLRYLIDSLQRSPVNGRRAMWRARFTADASER